MIDAAYVGGAALLAGGSAFGAIAACELRAEPADRSLPFVATALATAGGGFLATRGVELGNVAVTIVAIAAFAAALGGRRDAAIRNVLALAVLCVVVSSALSNHWYAPLAALAGAFPFMPSAFLRADRAATICAALLGALVCALFGIAVGLLLLFGGATLAIAVSAIARRRFSTGRFVPALGLCGLAAILVTTSLAG